MVYKTLVEKTFWGHVTPSFTQSLLQVELNPPQSALKWLQEGPPTKALFGPPQNVIFLIFQFLTSVGGPQNRDTKNGRRVCRVRKAGLPLHSSAEHLGFCVRGPFSSFSTLQILPQNRPSEQTSREGGGCPHTSFEGRLSFLPKKCLKGTLKKFFDDPQTCHIPDFPPVF